MQRPFEITIVDALVATSLRKALANVAQEGWEGERQAEAIAVQILCDPGDAVIAGHDGSVHVMAGFRLAMRLCCRVLSDPLHVHTSGTRRDVKDAMSLVDEWRNDRKPAYSNEAEPQISMLILRSAAA